METGMQDAMGAERALGSMVQQAEAQDTQMMDALALRGRFSDKGVKALAEAVEAGLGAMGLAGDDAKAAPEVSEDGEVGEDLTRKLQTVADAINDAVEAGVLDADLTLDLEGVQEDRDLTMLASRIRMAAADKGFKRWLKEGGEEEEPAGEEPSTEDAVSGEMSDDEVDEFFMGRM